MSSRFVIGLKSGNRRITFRKLKTRAPDLNAGWTADQINEHIDKLWLELRWFLTEEYHNFREFVIGAMTREQDTGPEPGQPICTSTCPCCGAHLEIEHGDEEGQIAVVGTRSTEEKQTTCGYCGGNLSIVCEGCGHVETLEEK